MEAKFSEDTIPQSLKDYLYTLPLNRARQSFLAILENAWKRKNNNQNSL